MPTDPSEHSRRALAYGCRLATEDKAELVILHVASDLNAWEFTSEFEAFAHGHGKIWPLDRVLSEASLDLNNFLEPHLEALKQIPSAKKRVVLGHVPDRITAVAEEEKADLIVRWRRHRPGHAHEPLPGLVHHRAVTFASLARQTGTAIFRLAQAAQRRDLTS